MWFYLGCVLVLTGVCAVIGWVATPTRNRVGWSSALSIVISAGLVIWSAVRTDDLARLVLLAILPVGWAAMTLASRARLARTRTADRAQQ